MEQTLIHHDNPVTVSVGQSGDSYTVTVGDSDFTVKKCFDDGREFSAEIDGERKTFFVARNRDTIFVFYEGRQYVFLEDNGGSPLRRGGRVEKGNFVSSPMPGTVVKINCGEGDIVSENDTLVIVEAMKMENVLRSQINGTVTKINNSVGDLVDAGAPIVEIEADI